MKKIYDVMKILDCYTYPPTAVELHMAIAPAHADCPCPYRPPCQEFKMWLAPDPFNRNPVSEANELAQTSHGQSTEGALRNMVELHNFMTS